MDAVSRKPVRARWSMASSAGPIARTDAADDAVLALASPRHAMRQILSLRAGDFSSHTPRLADESPRPAAKSTPAIVDHRRREDDTNPAFR